jgi:AbrB family looped-hinge helix DNA binding protein
MTRKGQVTIPKEIRKALGLKEHDKIIFSVKDNGEITLRPLRGSVLDLRGTVKPRQRPEDFDEMKEKVIKERAKKVAREIHDG